MYVSQFNGVLELFLDLTLVSMVMNIWILRQAVKLLCALWQKGWTNTVFDTR